MNKWLELLIGLVFIIAPLAIAITNVGGWGSATISFLKGAVIIFAVLIGLLFLMLGISDLKD